VEGWDEYNLGLLRYCHDIPLQESWMEASSFQVQVGHVLIELTFNHVFYDIFTVQCCI